MIDKKHKDCKKCSNRINCEKLIVNVRYDSVYCKTNRSLKIK